MSPLKILPEPSLEIHPWTRSPYRIPQTGDKLKAEMPIPAETKHREVSLVSVSPFGKRFRSVLVFPEPYTVASSNLAFHQIHRIIGQHPSWSCERAVIERTSDEVRTLETGKPLDEFDLIAFTVPFEMGYLNVLKSLQSSGIPLLSRERDGWHPLLLMGGIAPAANPTVMAPFMDAFLLGEGEASLPRFLDRLADLLETNAPKRGLLEACSILPGAYIPAVHGKTPPTIRFARVEDLDEFPPCSSWLTPETEFSNTFLFEISRGCPCGCRFCMIRLSQKPVRAVSPGRIMEFVESLPVTVPARKNGEYTRPKIGLVGAAVASHPEFEEICRMLRGRGWEITASAIEIDKATDGILEILAESQKTLTLAPERGLESERFRLGKKISDDHLLQVAERAGRLGIPRLKLYFVVGIIVPEFYGAFSDRPGLEVELPNWLDGYRDETDYTDRIFRHEADTIAELLRRISEVYRPQGMPGPVTVTCSPLVPKPHTPWSGWPMPKEKDLKKLDRILKKRLSTLPRVKYRAFGALEAILQGVLSQGNEDLEEFLVRATESPAELRSELRKILDSGTVSLFRRRWGETPPPWEFVKL